MDVQLFSKQASQFMIIKNFNSVVHICVISLWPCLSCLNPNWAGKFDVRYVVGGGGGDICPPSNLERIFQEKPYSFSILAKIIKSLQ